MSERRYDYSDDIESIVDMKDSTDGLGIELTTSDVVSRLNQLEAENERLQEWTDIESSYAHMFLVWMRLVKEHSEELYWELFDKACEHFDALLTRGDK